jgi:hypothetical protein
MEILFKILFQNSLGLNEDSGFALRAAGGRHAAVCPLRDAFERSCNYASYVSKHIQ